ncbi:MAG: FGGY-family carbohydrate kinase [Treponema sp.]|jgi:sugar (pentulose or hexulose) kinase|nr:FGGY-family carbohydrate kinase [Treponema sp.]
MKNTVLSVDIGSTSLKAALISDEGQFLDFSRQLFPAAENGGPDYQAAGNWLPAMQQAVKEFGNTINTVCAVCISGNGPTIVAETGETLLWNVQPPDTLSYNQKKTNSLFIPRLDIFRTIFPAVWHNSALIFSGPEYLIWQLTGTAVTILPEKRYREAYWTEEDLETFSIPEKKLPHYVYPSFNAGYIKTQLAASIGLPPDIPVFCGGPDFIVGLIGTGTLYNGTLCDCAGSSEGINFCSTIPLSGKGLLTLPSPLPGQWNTAALIPDSGIRFERFKRLHEKMLGTRISYEQLVTAIIRDKDSDGYKLLDDIAEKVKDAVELVKKAALSAELPWPDHMTVTGGQALNKQWMQLKCNLLNMDLVVKNCAQAELTGDAIVARIGLGDYSDIKQASTVLIHTNTVYQPRKEP